MIKSHILFLYFFVSLNVLGQNRTHSVFYDHTGLQKVIHDIETLYQVRFSYRSGLLDSLYFTCPRQKLNLNDLLQMIAGQTGLEFVRVRKGFYAIRPNPEPLDTQSLNEVTVNAYLTAGIRKCTDGSFDVRPRKLGILAGLIAPDVLESIQQLPGVVSLNETASGLSIRGGHTDQNQVYYDGIPIYQNGHLFGMISPFNPYNIKRVKYYFKGTPARYEGGASGIIDLSSGNRVAGKTTLSGGIGGLSADFEWESPVIKDRLSVSASVRTSYRGIWETPALKQFENKVFENTNVKTQTVRLNDFGFNDWTLKCNAAPNKKHRFSAGFIHIASYLDFHHKIEGYEDYDFRNQLKTTTNGFSMSARNTLGNGWTARTLFDWVWYDMQFVNRIIKARNGIGNIDKENFVSHTGMLTEFSRKSGSGIDYYIGYRYNEKRSAYLFRLVIDQNLYIFDYSRFSNNTHALFGSLRLRNFHSWDIDAGLNVPWYKELHRIFVEPRLVVSKKIFPHLKWQLTAETKHQNIQQNNKTVIGLLNLENKIWQVSRPAFPVLASRQITTGLLFNRNRWLLEVDFYNKQTENISISVPYRIYTEYRYLTGTSQAKGMDLYVKKRFLHIDFWASYSMMRVRYRFEKLKNNRSFVSDYQIRHKVLSTFVYHHQHFQAALSWLWHSPRPYYKDLLDHEDENIKPDFQIAYLPPYSRIDFSAFYGLRFGPTGKFKLKIGVSVRNLLNRKNILSHQQNSYGLDTRLLDFERYGLNRVFNVVLRFKWS